MAHPKTLAEKIYHLVQNHPEDFAFEVLGQSPVSYRELWARASAYANCVEQVSGHVSLCLPRGVDWVSALLGCWIVGKAPILLDPEWPELRKKEIQVEAGVEFTISETIQTAQEARHAISLPPDTPAYFIYSSGSSGKPKGIIVPHAGLVKMLKQQVEAFQMGSHTRALWLHNIAFDASISDIGTSLLARSTLCVGSSESRSSIKHFYAQLAEFQITHIDIPPALLAILDPTQVPPSLKSLVIGGSVCPESVVQKWAKHLHLVSVYGPTEATVCTSMAKCEAEWEEGQIGQPIDGITYEIVDANFNPSQEGELIISGQGVALGYLNQPELTKKRFLQLEKTRSFRTGDLVRKTNKNKFIFLGRLDRQIKRQGKLISPEEIEATLLNQADISKAFVAIHQNRLTAWIETPATLDSATLVQALNKKLPAWMIPSHWQFVEKIPTLSNEKIDQISLTKEQVPLPQNLLDDSPSGLLTKVARNLLKNPNFTCDDDFLLNGGDSLAIMQFLSSADELGFTLSPDCFYEHQTIRKILESESKNYQASSCDLLTKVEEFHPIETSKKSEPETPDSLLITGATGFLGSAILGEILTRTNLPVTCLVRGNLHEKQKVIAQKLELHGYESTRSFELIQSDLELPKFGLTQAAWSDLATRHTKIIHVGAATHSLAPYQLLEASNVHGTSSILNLQKEGVSKQLIYISTLSVFVDASPLPETCLESDERISPSTVFGGYAQSKWVAEQLVRRHSSNAHILRLGLLTPNQNTGYLTPEDTLSRILSRKAPLPSQENTPANASFDFTPVDYAASVAVDILLSESKPQTFHIANPIQVPAERLSQALKLAEIEPLTSSNHSAPPNSLTLFKTGGTSFSTRNTQAVQTRSCPEPSLEYLVKTFKLAKPHLDL